VWETIDAHARSPHRPLLAIRGDVPAELAAEVDRMLAKSPSHRQSTPAEVALALAALTDALGSGEPIPNQAKLTSAPAGTTSSGPDLTEINRCNEDFSATAAKDVDDGSRADTWSAAAQPVAHTTRRIGDRSSAEAFTREQPIDLVHSDLALNARRTERSRRFRQITRKSIDYLAVGGIICLVVGLMLKALDTGKYQWTMVRRVGWEGVHIFHTAFSPDGARFRGGGDTGKLRVWQVASRDGLVELPVVLRRVVAIKFLSPRLAASAVARLRFTCEAQAAAAINHPNVVTIHAVGEHDGFP
jgi:hypothetical protein